MDHLIQCHNLTAKRKFDQSSDNFFSTQKKIKTSTSASKLLNQNITTKGPDTLIQQFKLHGGYDVNSNSIIDKMSRLNEFVNLVKTDKALSTTNLLDIKGYGSQIFIK